MIGVYHDVGNYAGFLARILWLRDCSMGFEAIALVLRVPGCSGSGDRVLQRGKVSVR